MNIASLMEKQKASPGHTTGYGVLVPSSHQTKAASEPEPVCLYHLNAASKLTSPLRSSLCEHTHRAMLLQLHSSYFCSTMPLGSEAHLQSARISVLCRSVHITMHTQH